MRGHPCDYLGGKVRWNTQNPTAPPRPNFKWPCYTNDAGQAVYSDVYFNLAGVTYSTSTSLGTSGTNFYRSTQDYDNRGRPNRSVTAAGTIYRTVYDGLGRVVSEWVGTDDTPTSSFWSPTNLTGTDMVKIREYEYDGGGVGDSNLTETTEYPGLSAPARVSQTWYDWRNRAVATKAGVEVSESTSVNRPIGFTEYDNLGQVVSQESYDGDTVTPTDGNSDGVPDRPSSSLLRSKSTAAYDSWGRAYETTVWSVNPSTGSVSSTGLTTDTWFDLRGNAVKTASPGGLVQKMTYDGVGRVAASYASDGGGDAGWSDAFTVAGDIVLSESAKTYDANGNAIFSVSKDRFHTATGTGALGTPTTGVNARVSYFASYFDEADRLTDAVNVGTNGGTSYTRPGSPASRSDTALVTSYGYDSAGRLKDVTDPKGILNRTLYDAMGRTTKTIENYVDGTVSDTDDKTTEYAYGAAGMTGLTAKTTGGGGQTTAYIYGVTTGTGSAIASNDIVAKTQWPDETTGAASSGEEETTAVNALGQTVTASDRNGNVHTLSYDVLGRLTADAITTLGSGVDGAVRRVEYAYDGQGNQYLITQYDASSSGSVVSQVKREFNGLGQMTVEWQEHGGTVSGSTPKVEYAYSEMAGGANHSRLTKVTYPSGYAVTYRYSAAGVDNAISRLSALLDATGTLESYQYLGLGTAVVRSHPQVDLDLTYVLRVPEATGDGGDIYNGLDRFGRVVDQRWVDASSGTAASRNQYAYDRNGNRTEKLDLIESDFDEEYTYDGLNQLASFDRNSGDREIDWDYDALGNFQGVDVDGVAESRTHNAQNEVTSVGANSLTFDDNGNMTKDETGRVFKYDAWNRLVEVKASALGSVLVSYTYDGAGRRMTETRSGTTRHLFYGDQWQVLEEKVGANTSTRYVWSPVYVDAIVTRSRDTNADGSLDERLWAIQDANFNVVALIDGSGAVVERYAYDPYGTVTVLNPDYSVRGGGTSYGMNYGFQGLRFDSASGLNEARSRWYSSSLGRWNQVDRLGYSAADTNIFRAYANSPVLHGDPTGLFVPCKVFEKLDSTRRKEWVQLEEKGWRLKDTLIVGRVKPNINIAGYKHDYDDSVVSAVNQSAMIKLLASGVDIEWRSVGGTLYRGWAVDYSNKRIYVESPSDDVAATKLASLIAGLWAAGSASGWKGTDKYDISFRKGLSEDTHIEYDKTTDSLQLWAVTKQIPKDGGPVSIPTRRAVMQLWSLQYNSVAGVADTLTGFADNFASGPPGWKDAMLNALKLYGDAKNMAELEKIN